LTWWGSVVRVHLDAPFLSNSVLPPFSVHPIFSQSPSSVFIVLLRINTDVFLRYRKNVNLFLIL
jgi:hypothetical protein